MREILFRGKTQQPCGEWIYGSLLTNYPCCKNEVDETVKEYHIIDGKARELKMVQVIPETVGQYTGLTKNDNKIFEGDVFAWNDNEIDEITGKPYPDEISVVCFDDEKSAFVSKTLNGGCEGLYETISDKNSRYIGNIHDNPELLKGGD